MKTSFTIKNKLIIAGFIISAIGVTDIALAKTTIMDHSTMNHNKMIIAKGPPLTGFRLLRSDGLAAKSFAAKAFVCIQPLRGPLVCSQLWLKSWSAVGCVQSVGVQAVGEQSVGAYAVRV